MNMYILLLGISIGFTIGFIYGGFLEWDRFRPLTKDLQDELMESYKENDELRTIIHKNLGVVLRQTSAHPSLRSSRDR